MAKNPLKQLDPTIQSSKIVIYKPKGAVFFFSYASGQTYRQTLVTLRGVHKSTMTQWPGSAPLAGSRPKYNRIFLGPFPILPPGFVEIHPSSLHDPANKPTEQQVKT